MLPVTASSILNVEQADGKAVARLLVAELSWPTAEAIGNQLVALADKHCWRQLVLDLDQVHFLAAAALGKLIVLARRVAAGGGHLSIENAGSDVYEVFSITNLTEVLDVRPKETSSRPSAWPANLADSFLWPFCRSA